MDEVALIFYNMEPYFCRIIQMALTDESDPETWLQDYGDLLFRFALQRVRSEAIAEDLVQDTLLAGIQGFNKFNKQSSIKTWLVGILKHKIIDHYRKVSRESPALSDSDLGDDLLKYQFDDKCHWKANLVEWDTPEELLDNEQFWEAFHHCISRLPETMGNLFMLRTVEGLSSEDCCKVLNFKSTNHLWVVLSRTRMKLRQCLEIQWFDKQ